MGPRGRGISIGSPASAELTVATKKQLTVRSRYGATSAAIASIQNVRAKRLMHRKQGHHGSANSVIITFFTSATPGVTPRKLLAYLKTRKRTET